jgi:hypothetical protein
MDIPNFLYTQFPEGKELFDKINAGLLGIEKEKKEELFPKIQFAEAKEAVVLTLVVYRFLIYIQISSWRMLDISKAILKMWEDKNIASAFILLRSLYETVSVIFYTNMKLEGLIKAGEFKPIHNLIINLTYGTRIQDKIEEDVKIHLKRIKQGIGDYKDEAEIREVFTAKSVLTAIDKIVKVEPEHRNDYDHLSEYTHPNFDAMMGLYGKFKEDELTLTISNEKGLSEVNFQNFFSRFNTCIYMFMEAYNAILNKFNDITTIAIEDLKKSGREDKLYKLPIKLNEQ